MSATAKNEVRPSLHHVTMKTSRLDEMIKWYGLVLGTQVQFRNETAAWTTNDGANHRIAFLAVPGLSDDADKVRHNGMHHCAFEYGSFAELMSTYDRLRQSGVEPAFSLDHGMTMSL
jgi:catechol 2,3-dioxygenase